MILGCSGWVDLYKDSAGVGSECDLFKGYYGLEGMIFKSEETGRTPHVAVKIQHIRRDG